jgi:glycosyltransferase involved in cell wall biosynthesis
MKYNVVIFCPDSHIVYNLHTLEKIGVGGGITSRIRIAHALANIGHDVTLFINCPRNETIDGVKYRHFSQFSNIDTDVFIASSSGGRFELKELSNFQVNSKIKILEIHGVVYPKTIAFEDFDYIYFPSNFILKSVTQETIIDRHHTYVSFRGICKSNFYSLIKLNRNLYNLVYLGHPVKGFDQALSILKILRNHDPKFKLHFYGGYKLWGEAEKNIGRVPGLINHGVIGQKRLAKEIQKMNFCLNLQSIPEGFGCSVSESMRAGCIVLTSPVGAYPEFVRNGYNGFLIPGFHTDPNVHEKAAKLILQLMETPDYMDFIRTNAINTPINWQTIAKAWEGHWDWHLKNKGKQNITDNVIKGCSQCGGNLLALADGLHCIECGNYQQSFEL